ncbi:class I SAM-dependent methyltransferase [Actinoalloteichus caeruleus]|uniref:O-methyltransferase n=2 Tax=Actinoalloteichus cyanogriseus TaxID=2893586 RepID=A0ABT1JEH5_ACTCY|nr:class I SAM-dependent methyltransferase [Actinoalloteichus caeruleus]MCP2330568.1 O-methyltransferase [Actinoalloteichus caeruleus DSM 43889]
MTNEPPSTQHLTALAAPDALIDWRLAVCYETAHTTGILDELPATAADIADARDLDPDAVRAVLFVLAGWHYATVDEHDVFSLGPNRPQPHERAALAQHGSWIRRWAALVPRRVRDRKATAPDTPPPMDPATGLALLESAGRPFVSAVVDTCLDGWRPRTGDRDSAHVLDLGGGHGAYAREFARRGCITTMQDLPGVIELARADGRSAAAGVELVAADAVTDLAPGPFDLVLCGNLTNLFPLDQVRDLLNRLRDVLAPDGQVAIASWLRDHGPVGAAFGVQMLVATTAGDAHGESDYRRVCADAGYTDIRFVDVDHARFTVVLARPAPTT